MDAIRNWSGVKWVTLCVYIWNQLLSCEKNTLLRALKSLTVESSWTSNITQITTSCNSTVWRSKISYIVRLIPLSKFTFLWWLCQTTMPPPFCCCFSLVCTHVGMKASHMVRDFSIICTKEDPAAYTRLTYCRMHITVLYPNAGSHVQSEFVSCHLGLRKDKNTLIYRQMTT